jgi:hypothetical protein
MGANPAAHLSLRVGSRHQVSFVPYPRRSPLFVIGAGSAQVSLTLPDQLDAAHVEFARHLASQAWAYAVAVERRYRGLPPLPDAPLPHWLAAGTLPDGEVVWAYQEPQADRQELTA